MKRRLTFLLAFVLVLSMFLAVSLSASEGEKKEISGFRGFEWGMGYEDVLESLKDEFGEGMLREDVDDSKVPGRYKGILLSGQTVGGHETNAGYLFEDDELAIGTYTLSLKDEDVFNDLLEKYTDVYGDPYVYKPSVDIFGQAAMWADSDGNIIWMSQTAGLGYVAAWSHFIEDNDYDKVFQRYHGFSLTERAGQFENYEGI